MHPSEHHDMYLEKIHPSGVEEWYCSTCKRCLLVIWKPRFMVITREAGEQYEIHRISDDGLNVESARVPSIVDILGQAEADILNEDPWLLPWIAWMEKSGFENLWNAED